MRLVVTCLTLTVLLAAGLGPAYADPAQPFDETAPYASAYDITCDLLDAGTYTYQWVLDYNGVPPFYDPYQQYVGRVVVYDTAVEYDGGGVVERWTGTDWASAVGWSASKDGGGVAVEWSYNSGASDRIHPGGRLRLTASVDGPLTDCMMTSIHIGAWGPNEDSIWVNNTPELPPSVLLSLGMLPLGIAYLRGRRRGSN